MRRIPRKVHTVNSLNVSIAIADRTDAQDLATLRSNVARGLTEEFGHGHWSPCPSRAEVVRNLRASHVLIARRESQIVGTVRLVVAEQSAIDSTAFTPVDTALYVLGLAVSRDTRGQGIGRSLMEAAKDAARAWPADALWLDAYQQEGVGAGPFYLKCGFRAVGPSALQEVPLTYYEWLARPN